MATPNEKLAASLDQLKELQSQGRRVFESKELTRVNRDRLIKNGFLRQVVIGWLITANPGANEGDTTPWYTSFWEFCARYCDKRFGQNWHLSPEQSLLLHGENTIIPLQVVVYTPKGTNNTIDLLFGTSLYDLKQTKKQSPPPGDLTMRDGLRLYSPAAALIKVGSLNVILCKARGGRKNQLCGNTHSHALKATIMPARLTVIQQ